MVLESWVQSGLSDEERRDRAADDVSKGGRQIELISYFQPEAGFVDDCAGRPRLGRDSSHQSDAQARSPDQQRERRVDGIEPADGSDVGDYLSKERTHTQSVSPLRTA